MRRPFLRPLLLHQTIRIHPRSKTSPLYPKNLSKTYSIHNNATANRPSQFHIAIIGSGPAGFYTAHRIQHKLPSARIDMYEQLPAPYGLVRYGVAPDHPEVKLRTAPPHSPPSPNTRTSHT
jgi:hypothetical protein